MFYRIASLILCLLATYPLSLLLQIAGDWFLGDGEFVRAFLFGSKRELAGVMLGDWQSSVPWTLSMACTAMIILYYGRRISPSLVWLALLVPPICAMFFQLAHIFYFMWFILCFLLALRHFVNVRLLPFLKGNTQ